MGSWEAPIILIVDDDKGIRELFGVLLQSEGFPVALAGDGAQAWRRLADLPCRLVISDYAMPEEDGVQLLAAIRGEYPGMRTMLTSAHRELPELARQAGADGYYRKCRPLNELTALARALLEEAGG